MSKFLIKIEKYITLGKSGKFLSSKLLNFDQKEIK